MLTNFENELKQNCEEDREPEEDVMVKYREKVSLRKDFQDVFKILTMSDIDKIKHDYLTYRINRLREVYSKLAELINSHK